MNGLIRYVESISFYLRWIFISPRERYAYLWAKTKKLGDSDYTVRNTVVNTNK